MIVLDTSIWIEFLKKNSNYFNDVRDILEDQIVYGVEFIFGELLQGSRNKKEQNIITGYWGNISIINTEGIWIEAGIISADKKLHSKGIGLIDCAIVQSARRVKAQVWSLDKKLNSLLNKDEKYFV